MPATWKVHAGDTVRPGRMALTLTAWGAYPRARKDRKIGRPIATGNEGPMADQPFTDFL